MKRTRAIRYPEEIRHRIEGDIDKSILDRLDDQAANFRQIETRRGEISKAAERLRQVGYLRE